MSLLGGVRAAHNARVSVDLATQTSTHKDRSLTRRHLFRAAALLLAPPPSLPPGATNSRPPPPLALTCSAVSRDSPCLVRPSAAECLE